MASSAAAAAAAVGLEQNNNNTNVNSNSNDPETSSLATASLSKPATGGTSSVHHLAQRAIDVTATSWQQWMTPRYALPNKAVASQVLMYRQLLHTACRPGLKLSRDYQGTPAQRAVLYMPWWEQGIEETRKMIISYDNLMSRLWFHGAIKPFDNNGETTVIHNEDFTSGPPPVPHEYWVSRLGFQQPDPVTDFRSGGVLSLAMMVYMVESCPLVVRRFLQEDSPDRIVLPFAITCINVTDMLAKFLMLSKSVAQMDALLSQKPFWRMFDDPQSILSLQEISMTFLCDVVNELQQERQAAAAAAIASQQQQATTSNGGVASVRKLLWQSSAPPSDQESQQQQNLADCESNQASAVEGQKSQLMEIPDTKVTVFDFSQIMERTERRVRDDLLGAGPKTVPDLQILAEKLRSKYQSQLEKRIAPPATSGSSFPFKSTTAAGANPTDTAAVADVVDDGTIPNSNNNNVDGSRKIPSRVGGAAGAIWNKVKSTTVAASKIISTPLTSASNNNTSGVESPPDLLSGDVPGCTAGQSTAEATTSAAAGIPSGELQDWEGTDIASASDTIKHFSISDEEEDELL